MVRRSVTLLVVAMLGAMLPLGSALAVRNDVVEISQASTTATSIAFSQATFDDADTVLIGRDGLFADSLASGALQGTTSPLLLTDTDELAAGVLTEIDRLGATSAIILGGTVAISDDVVDALTDAGLEVSRRQGTTRIETAIDVADDLDATTALLVRAFPAAGGDDTQAFADSIAAGAWAAAEGWPVLFTETDRLTTSTSTFLAGSSITDVIVIGGTAAVGTPVTDALDALELTWRRVAGAHRFQTAIEIAAERGFDSEADADRVLLLEGQDTDAWAAGFSAAAHAAIHDAPIVLSNGTDLPAATEAFLSDSAFAVDEGNITGPVLVCASTDEACDAAKAALGLPADATVTITSGQIDPGGTVTGTFDDGGTAASVDINGCGIATSTDLVIAADGTFSIDLANDQDADCTLTFEILFGNGTTQIETRAIDILSPDETSQSGQIIATGANTYTFVTSAGLTVAVTYDTDDNFEIGGTTSSRAAWIATVQVGNMVTFSDDTGEDDLDTHNLTTTGAVVSGQIANVDLANTEYDFVEPFTQTVVRADVDYAANDDATYRIGSSSANEASFSAELNEGDTVVITDDGGTSERHSVTNASVVGMVTSVDSQGAITEIIVGNRGDDPANNQDTEFVTSAADNFTGSVADTYLEFQEEVDLGDTVTYSRTGGIETYRLANSAPPTVSGTVTNATDGNNVVTYLPGDGASTATFTHTGVSYRVGGSIVLEAEFEAALTPGDSVTFTPDNPNTGANEERASLTNRNLAGRPTDVQTGANTVDVVNAAGGVIADDLDYTTSLYAGAQARYEVDGSEVSLAQFETALGTVDSGSTLTARPIGNDVGTTYDLDV